jgi:Transposase domain (DUF772)
MTCMRRWGGRRFRRSGCSGAVAAGVVHGAQGTAADGALDYNFLFRWFVGLSIDDPVWDVTVFTKTRDRLLKGEVAEAFFAAVLAQARQPTSTSRLTAH